MGDSQAADNPRPDPPRQRTVFDGFRPRRLPTLTNAVEPRQGETSSPWRRRVKRTLLALLFATLVAAGLTVLVEAHTGMPPESLLRWFPIFFWGVFQTVAAAFLAGLLLLELRETTGRRDKALPSSTLTPAARQTVSPATEPHTIELPITHAVRTALPGNRPRSGGEWMKRQFPWPPTVRTYRSALVTAFALLFFAASLSYPGSTVGWLIILAIFIGVVALFSVGSQRRHLLELAPDVAAGVYLRTTGPAMLVRQPGHPSPDSDEAPDMYRIEIISPMQIDAPNGDFAIAWDIDPSGLTPFWRQAAMGNYELGPSPITMDYLKHSLLLLEVRDAEGGLLYRHPDYYPD